MSSDLERDLKETAPAPRTKLNFTDIWMRSRQLRRRRNIYVIGVAALIVAGVVGVVSASPFGDVPAVKPVASPSPTPKAEDRRAELAEMTAKYRVTLQKLRRAMARLDAHSSQIRDAFRDARRARARVRMQRLRAQLVALISERAELESRIEIIVDRLRNLRSTLPKDQQSACAKGGAVRADVTGDDSAEFVFHRWDKGRAVVDVCLRGRVMPGFGHGRLFRIPGIGQAELLTIIDVEGDGRDEIFFGSTSIGSAAFEIGVFQGRLRAVELTDDYELSGYLQQGDRLRVWSGFELGFAGDTRDAGTAFGCEDFNGDGTRDLVQAVAMPAGDHLEWSLQAFAIRGFYAEKVGDNSGIATDLGKSDPVEFARSLVTPCEPKATN